MGWTQSINISDAMPEKLSLTPGSYIMEGENLFLSIVFDLYLHAVCNVDAMANINNMHK